MGTLLIPIFRVNLLLVDNIFHIKFGTVFCVALRHNDTATCE